MNKMNFIFFTIQNWSMKMHSVFVNCISSFTNLKSYQWAIHIVDNHSKLIGIIRDKQKLKLGYSNFFKISIIRLEVG